MIEDRSYSKDRIFRKQNERNVFFDVIRRYYGLKTAKENTVLHSAPNNWKTERGAYGWAKKHGYEVPKSVEKAPKAKSKAKGKPAKKKQK